MTDDHRWAQRHLSRYLDGDLSSRGRRRLDRHSRDCADCGGSIRAMRALIYAAQGLGGPAGVRAPVTIFDRVRLAAEQGPRPAAGPQGPEASSRPAGPEASSRPAGPEASSRPAGPAEQA
jgi:hypothetical protein